MRFSFPAMGLNNVKSWRNRHFRHKFKYAMISASVCKMGTKTMWNDTLLESTVGIWEQKVVKKIPANAQGRCDPVTYPRHLNTKKGGVDPRGYVLKLHAAIGLSVAICFSFPHGRCPPLTLPSVALPFTFYLAWSRTNSLRSNKIVRLDFNITFGGIAPVRFFRGPLFLDVWMCVAAHFNMF